MPQKKIRGHKRRRKHIRQWIDRYKHLSPEYIEMALRSYVKIRVHPWGGLNLDGSKPPEPYGETKLRMLEGLIEIYDEWKKVLDARGKPYYLKIWLFEPHFTQSQVVCAIEPALEFYENTFFKPDDAKEIRLSNYGRLKDTMSDFMWDYRLDELILDEDRVGAPEEYVSLQEYEKDKKWFKRKMQQPHRTITYKRDGENHQYYAFKKGVVWLGERA